MTRLLRFLARKLGAGKLDFTVIGDTVNPVARVERQTRVTGDDVPVTDATREAAAGGGRLG